MEYDIIKTLKEYCKFSTGTSFGGGQMGAFAPPEFEK